MFRAEIIKQREHELLLKTIAPLSQKTDIGNELSSVRAEPRKIPAEEKTEDNLPAIPLKVAKQSTTLLTVNSLPKASELMSSTRSPSTLLEDISLSDEPIGLEKDTILSKTHDISWQVGNLIVPLDKNWLLKSSSFRLKSSDLTTHTRRYSNTSGDYSPQECTDSSTPTFSSSPTIASVHSELVRNDDSSNATISEVALIPPTNLKSSKSFSITGKARTDKVFGFGT